MRNAELNEFFALRLNIAVKKHQISYRETNVGLSMMCYKNQKTSPKDKKEYK